MILIPDTPSSMTCLWSLDNNNAKCFYCAQKTLYNMKINVFSVSGKKDDDVSLSESEKLFTNARNENSEIAWIAIVGFYYHGNITALVWTHKFYVHQKCIFKEITKIKE